MTDIAQADTETITRTWSLVDGSAVAVVPTSVTFYARVNATDVTWTTDGAGASILGVVDNGDGTGSWTVTAGDLGVNVYRWWALAVVGTETVIPTGMTGTLTIRDR